MLDFEAFCFIAEFSDSFPIFFFL